jgi:geranylgeranyl pyrophosphate synthase
MDKAADALGPWAKAGREQVDALLAARFEDAWPPRFQEACRYPIATGGKRMRPLLVLAAAEALGRSGDATVQHAAAAVELVHAYSLVHDDLPAMDDDAERRGRPTVHIAYDEATAILVGDALLTEAFAVIADCPASAESRIAMTRCLARAAGHRGMVGGQAADVGLGGPVGDLDALLALHRGKTGALIQAAVQLGGLAAGADAADLERLGAYGAAVGLAFQLADDVLDSDQDAGEHGPPSFVKLMGAEATQTRARALVEEAIAAIAPLPPPQRLITLARFTIDRSS